MSSHSDMVHRDTDWARHERQQYDDLQDFPMHDASDSSNNPILFYDRNQPYYEFTNFSRHAVVYGCLIYPTAEHLFQASKFIDHHPIIAEKIRHLPTPRDALREATHLRHLRRPDWFEVNVAIMDTILEAKFTQHLALRQLLLNTGERELVEDSPTDAFWGIGGNRQGRNELGKALVRLRSKLRAIPSSPFIKQQ